VRVTLVGAGPGDADLLTLRAEAELAAAATVVSDARVQALARAFAPRAELVVVPDGAAGVPAILAAALQPNGDVVRLYVGDPWLHPAHGEELAALHQAGVATEAIAGVAVELGVPAQAGIAVHVRHLAVVCTLGSVEEVPRLVDPAHTLVVSGKDGAAAARHLAARGGQDLPAAILPLDGGPGEERGLVGSLALGAGDAGPSLLVVGAVAARGAAGRRSTAPVPGVLPQAIRGGDR